jgi:hypothetical protein
MSPHHLAPDHLQPMVFIPLHLLAYILPLPMVTTLVHITLPHLLVCTLVIPLVPHLLYLLDIHLLLHLLFYLLALHILPYLLAPHPLILHLVSTIHLLLAYTLLLLFLV